MCIQYFAVLDSYGMLPVDDDARGARRACRISQVVPVRPRQVRMIGCRSRLVAGAQRLVARAQRADRHAPPVLEHGLQPSSNSGRSPTTPISEWKWLSRSAGRSGNAGARSARNPRTGSERTTWPW